MIQHGILLHTIDQTQDEFGTDRFFVADANGDWVSEALDTYEEAAEWIRDAEQERLA